MNPTREDTLKVLYAEVLEWADRFRAAVKANDEIEASVSARWLGLKTDSVVEFLDDDATSVVEELEEVRFKLGSSGEPMPVSQYLEYIASTMKVTLPEIPSQATYWRWLKESKEGFMRMSIKHESLLNRFLDKMEKKLKPAKKAAVGSIRK